MTRFLCSLISILLFTIGLSAQNNQALSIAERHIIDRSGSFSNTALTAEEIGMSSISEDKITGLTHVYLKQLYSGIEIDNVISSVHIKGDGSIFHENNQFLEISGRSITSTEILSRTRAIDMAAAEFGFEEISTSTLQRDNGGLDKEAIYDNDNLALGPITVDLKYVALPGRLVLSWDVQFTKKDDHFMWNVKVDVNTGEVIDKSTYTVQCRWDDGEDHQAHVGHDHTEQQAKDEEQRSALPFVNDSYNIFPIPGESPIHIARTLVTAPWTMAPTASPFGWHDTDGVLGPEFTITRGNNAYAYLDRDGNSVPNNSPDGGANLMFDFPLDLTTQAPTDYQDAAAVNLFYMNNIVHDVMYLYGFDEESGNFQENNYGNGGVGSDAVNAEAQSGADIGAANNAFFGTPPDGAEPTMMMFEFTFTNPRRDSDLDNGIIAHEYGHGISNRLTAGPANTNCLDRFTTPEQMGEGWSDYCTLIMSMEPGDTGPLARGAGTYVLGQPTTGAGIRQHPYTTDMMINPHTYADISSVSVPHGVGSVWAVMLWEMTWALIDKYGFNPNIYDVSSTAGNILALKLVNAGMKLQPCSPGFVDGRDAILAADMAMTGGANQCEIWAAFAKRGLGLSADQGLSSSVFDGTEAFDVPECITCDDGIQNGDEEGVDCGGSMCPACPTCTDGIMNGDETGVDCGGPTCPVCPTCDDNMQNGDETGVDCGGSSCPICPCTEAQLSKLYMDVTVPDATVDHIKDSINTAGVVLVANGDSVVWRAGKAINISGTFTAENNALLFIQVEDCELPPGFDGNE